MVMICECGCGHVGRCGCDKIGECGSVVMICGHGYGHDR